ncbi:MAG: two-component system regulatory protein YycI [Sporolactobacillus sp.]
MNWKKTKSIFIICFLLLNAFLIFELYMRQQDEEAQGITGSGKGNQTNFQMDVQIPPTPDRVTFLRGQRIDFNQEKNTLALLTSSDRNAGQKIKIGNEGMELSSVLKGSFSGSLKNTELQKSVLGLVYQGQSYNYWHADRKAGTTDFTQLYNGHPVFISQRSNIHMLQFTKNAQRITSYRQSYFRFRQVNHVDIISAKMAISNLAENTNLLENGHPTIKVIELSYINLVGDAGSDPLIFIPAWHIVVQTGHHLQEFFVNAMSGNIQQLDGP